MRKALIFFNLLILSIPLFAQGQVVTSKNLIGIWKQATRMISVGGDSDMTTDYLIFTNDDTFFLLNESGDKSNLSIKSYGTYRVLSDSVLIRTDKMRNDSNMVINDRTTKFRLSNDSLVFVYNIVGIEYLFKMIREMPEKQMIK